MTTGETRDAKHSMNQTVQKNAARVRTVRSNNARKEMVRERMLDKSAELFCTNGFSQTSINDIADALSLKRPSVYHYFANKEEIVEALLSEEYGRRSAELLGLFERTDLSSLQRLEVAVESAITKRLSGGNRFPVFDRLLERELPSDLRASYDRQRRKILDLYSRLISDGIDAGQLRAVDPDIAALSLIGMTNWTALWYSPHDPLPPSEIAKILVDMFAHGVSKSAGGSQPPSSIEAAIRNLRDAVAHLERLTLIGNSSDSAAM